MSDTAPRPREAILGAAPFLTSFVGRRAERERLDELLRDPTVRWLTLTGPGGVGKTRLALEAARAFAERAGVPVAFVSLADIATPEAMLAQIAARLEPAAADRDPQETLRRWFDDRPALLILDNAEQLVVAGSTLSALLTAPGCARLSLLVTSRVPFGFSGEHVLPIGPMPAPDANAPVTPADLAANDAAQLFLARARAARADLRLDAVDAGVVAAICRRLDGLPLAIELAAARTGMLSFSALLARLARRLPELTGAPRDAPERHRTMRDAIAWGYDLLTPDLQHLLRRLAVCSGGFSPELAARLVRGRKSGRGYPFADGYGLPFGFANVFDDPGPSEAPELDRAFPLSPIPLDPEAGVRHLLDWSFVYRADDARAEPRFAMLETIREFALERLAEDGEEDAVRHAHAAATLAFAEAANEGAWARSKRRVSLDQIGADLGNVRSALDWLLQRGPAADLALRLVDSMSPYWQTRGLLEGRAQTERALAAGAGSVYRRLNAHCSLGFLNWILGDDARAEAALTIALTLAEQPGSYGRKGVAHFHMALVEWRKGPHRIFAMLDHLEAATAAFSAWNDWIGLGVCKLAMGEAARLTDSPETAVALFDEAFALHDAGGYDWGVATSRYFAGEARRDQRCYPEAAALLCDGLRRYWAAGDAWGAGGCICGLACVAAARTEWTVAARLFGAARRLREHTHAVLPPTHQEAYDAIGELVLAQTGDEDEERGWLLTPEQAVAEALALGARFARDEPPPHGNRPPKKLTRTQRAVIAEFARGYDQEQIAKRLGRSTSAIYAHTKAVRDAWGLASYDELRKRARELGLNRLD